MRYKDIYQPFLTLFGALLLCYGCIAYPPQLPTESPKPTTPSTATLSPINTQTATPTFTFVPTLIPADASTRLRELIQTNGGCEFPCWWGLVPGSDDFQTFHSELLSLGKLILKDYGEYIILEDALDQNTVLRIFTDFRITNGVVNAIFISIMASRKTELGYEGDYYNQSFERLTESYSLHEILSQYGQPSEVLLQGWPYNDSREPYFALLIVYEEKGIAVRYEGSAPFTTNRTMKVCPLHSRPNLLVWNPSDGVRFDLIGEIKMGWAAPPFKPIQDATGMDSNDFYQTMQDPQACFETPVDLWDE